MTRIIEVRSTKPKGFLKFAANSTVADDLQDDIFDLKGTMNCMQGWRMDADFEPHTEYDFVVNVNEDFGSLDAIKGFVDKYKCSIIVLQERDCPDDENRTQDHIIYKGFNSDA